MSRGFTLIELLVVIAIIGLLSSIVLSSLQVARLKAADAAVQQEAAQMRVLMEQERSNSGTYVAIKSGGTGSGTAGFIPWNGACGAFSGQFASKAADICQKLVAAASTGGSASTGCGQACVYFLQTSPNNAEKYSIQAYLPYASQQAGHLQYLCLGSSGNQSVSDGAAWLEDGCYKNP